MLPCHLGGADGGIFQWPNAYTVSALIDASQNLFREMPVDVRQKFELKNEGNCLSEASSSLN
jgi:hypothetical protein